MAKLKHQALGNYAWMQVIRRSDLPQQIKAVAFILGISANPDGSGASCGQKRLADEAICDERYARDSVEALELLGLIEVTRYGRTATDANTYQLTTPGGDLPAIPMRRDPKGVPLGVDGQPRVGKRPKPLAVRPLLALLQGREVPDRPMPVERGGNPVPEPDPTGAVDNSDSTGNPVPLRLVDDPEATDGYRHPVAATEPVDNQPYRQRVARVPATGCTGTGNPVPPTNLFLLSPTNSPQATQSPTRDGDACGQPEEVDEGSGPPVEPGADEYTTAVAVLSRFEDPTPWYAAAFTELAADGQPDPPMRTAAIRAAKLAAAAEHATNGVA